MFVAMGVSELLYDTIDTCQGFKTCSDMNMYLRDGNE